MKKTPDIVKKIQQTKLPEVDHRFQKSLSYSQFSTYRGCPHKWAFRYKEGNYEDSPSIHALFGTALHETLQHYLDIMYDKSAAEADRINIEEYFEENLRKSYAESYKKNKNVHFSTPEEIREFYEDGINILKFFKKKRGRYFSKKGTYLVGCEIPIILAPNPYLQRVKYMGYLDVVLYNETLNKFTIIDIKTSTKGWNKWAKKDEIKQFQLVLYKKFFSQQYNIPIEDIDIEFFIVKRKIWEDTEYPMSRIQQFTPASGKTKLNKASKLLETFIKDVFSLDGTYKDRTFIPKPSKWNCTFCPFKEDSKLCSAVGKNL